MKNTKNEIFSWGEACIYAKESAQTTGRTLRPSDLPPHIPRMKSKEAFEYYNEKFNKYWETVYGKSSNRQSA